ncbi:MAG: sigma-70 family RNA polymerase sigma factor [Desulfococcaceae bacterium]|jgi:RNA polymerase sigma factor (sigma-70 family)|nr:sigma-70 family RNA polymerase sigma factor [Desulfococcaceae bacterium]
MKAISKEEEEQILDECLKQGKKEGIVRQYYRLILKIVRDRVEKESLFYSREDIDDIVHDVFVRLFDNHCRRLRQYDPVKGKNLAYWIILISLQTASDFITRKKKDKVFETESEETDENDPVRGLKYEINLQQEENRMEARSELRQIIRLTEQLTPEQQLVMQLSFFDKPPLTPEEIAEMTGKSIKAVYSLKFRAVQQLKELLRTVG